MAVLANRSPTVRTVLFDARDATAAKPLHERFRRDGLFEAVHLAAHGLNQAGRAEIEAQFVGIVDEALGVPTADLVIDGWRRHEELLAAARTTLADPATTVTVNLAPHRINTDHTWIIDVIVVKVCMSIAFNLSVVFDIDALPASVRAGRLVGLGAGKCTVHAKLCAETQLIAEQSVEFELENQLTLDPGPALIEAPSTVSGRTSPRNVEFTLPPPSA